MKILVAVKRVVDPYVTVRVKSDQSGVDTDNLKMSINPFDEIAIEEALCCREKNQVKEIVAVSIGPASHQETLRHALALGVDRGILVETNNPLCSLHVAKILHKIISEEKPALVLMGKQSIDGDNNQTPQMLAALLDWPQATYASAMKWVDNTVEVTREIDGGLETLSVELPAVISTDLRLNTPRYANLLNIMKAKQKPLSVIPLDSLGLHLKQHIELCRVSSPPTKSAGIKIASVEMLIDKLKHEAKVL